MNEQRWKQRFQNFQKCFSFLEDCAKDAHLDVKSDIAIIKAYEMSFELAWKTLQDYLRHQGQNPAGPRDALKAAFSLGILDKGHIWIEMLDQRNTLVHIYDQSAAKLAVDRITGEFLPAFSELAHKLGTIP